MRIINTPGFTNKVAATLDIIATLFIEYLGTTYKMPFYHPIILITVAGMTYGLFKWKKEITIFCLGALDPVQNKNWYSYQFEQTKRKISSLLTN